MSSNRFSVTTRALRVGQGGVPRRLMAATLIVSLGPLASSTCVPVAFGGSRFASPASVCRTPPLATSMNVAPLRSITWYGTSANVADDTRRQCGCRGRGGLAVRGVRTGERDRQAEAGGHRAVENAQADLVPCIRQAYGGMDQDGPYALWA